MSIFRVIFLKDTSYHAYLLPQILPRWPIESRLIGALLRPSLLCLVTFPDLPPPHPLTYATGRPPDTSWYSGLYGLVSAFSWPTVHSYLSSRFRRIPAFSRKSSLILTPCSRQIQGLPFSVLMALPHHILL